MGGAARGGQSRPQEAGVGLTRTRHSVLSGRDVAPPSADLDTLLVALYVVADDLLPKRVGRGRPPRIANAELVCLAVAQVLLDCPSERRWLRFARRRLGHLFPYLPKQPGYNKRMRALAPEVCLVLRHLAGRSPSVDDSVRLLDSTPVACGASRETVKRSELTGHASYGYCVSHRRFFWGFRLHLLCTPDGMPVDFCLAPANSPEREVAAAMLERRPLPPGQVVVTDKGFAGSDFERLVASMGALLVRPDRKDERTRFGSLGRVRQWIESVFDTLKGQLSLERHGGRTPAGVFVRVAQRLLALAAAVWLNRQIGRPRRSLIAYDH